MGIKFQKSNENKIEFAKLGYASTVKSKPVEIHATVFAQNDDFEYIWRVDDESIASVAPDGTITALKQGYTFATLIAKSDKTEIIKDINIVVLSDDPYIDVTDQKGTLYANHMTNMHTQVFDIDPLTKDIYYIANEEANVLSVNKFTPDGKHEIMSLVGFSHGIALSLEREGDEVYLWLSCDNDAATCRMKFTAGETFEKNAGQVFHYSCVHALDMANRTALVMIGADMVVFDLDDLIKNGDNAKRLAAAHVPEHCRIYQYQCVDIMGKYMYLYYTVGNTAGKATSGDYLDCRMVCVDITTDELVYEGNVLSTQGEKYSEAEGLQIIKEPDGSIHAYCQINSTTLRVGIFRI